MGRLESDAVVLRTFPLSETDRIVVVYTRKYGRVRGVARGARRTRSRFSGRLELFHWVEFHGYERETQELVKIDKVELIESFSSKLTNYRCFLQLSVLAELLMKTVPDREPNEPLFRLLLIVLPEFRQESRGDLAQLYFEIWHLRLAGLFPEVGSCCQCGSSLRIELQQFYSSAFQGFCCSKCKGDSSLLVSPMAYQLLWETLKKPIKSILINQVSSELEAVQELSRMVELLLERNFERKLDCLEFVHQS
jgi:DNA repair protein RecO (recombination protein O)